MLRSLPQEILDLIIDYLRDEPNTLKTCSTVSKSWVQRTQKHFLAQINFHPPSSSLSLWREAFPDPTNSPAHHARTLSIRHPELITTADTDTLRTFCGVVCLKVHAGLPCNQAVSLVPLHGFSPIIRSLHLICTILQNSEVFGLICSFPLLEDLALISRARRRRDEVWNAPLTSPKLTGSLDLHMGEGIRLVTRRLLDLPNGLHFTRIVVPLVYQEDVRWIMDLVSKCSGTLESLAVTNHLFDKPGVLDLSKSTKLKDLLFICNEPTVEWIITTLHTAEIKNLRQISLGLFCRGVSRETTSEMVHQKWLSLDRLLVQLWTSHSPHLKLTYKLREGENDEMNHVVRWLLPESTSRGIIDLVGYGA